MARFATHALLLVTGSHAAIPLISFYSVSAQDNYVTATALGMDEAVAAGYLLCGRPGDGNCPPDGSIVTNATDAIPEGTIPLWQWYSPSRQDHILFATDATRHSMDSLDYTPVRMEGYAYASPGRGRVALRLWWNEKRQDNFLCVEGGQAEGLARSSGYRLVRTEAFVEAAMQWLRWPDAPPATIPVPKSEDILAFEFNSGANANYGGADTWYPSWGADNRLYTPWTDGSVTDMVTKENVRSQSWHGSGATTGMAIVLGDDPFNLTITNVSTFHASSAPYQGRYPCGSLYYKGTWFYGTYYLENPSFPPNPEPNCGNWCVQGPFAGFRYSTDDGRTWTEPRLPAKNESDNLFAEDAMNNGKVKFGAPHIVDFGRELEHSPDGKVYIIGHGATRPEAHQSWMQGDQVYLARCEPTVECMMDGKQWEFFAGHDAGGAAQWRQGELDAAQPILEWNNHTGVVTMTYFPALRKYVMVVSTPTFTPYTTKQFDTYFLESDNLTGPFRYITYMSEFGPEAYFVHYPSKFLDTTVTEARVTDNSSRAVLHGFLSYSANFAFKQSSNPPGSGYWWSLQEMRLVLGSHYTGAAQAAALV